MTEQEQRIKIAETCGLEWKNMIRDSEVERYEQTGDLPFNCLIPNYTVDLNAMHEAEKILNQKQQHEYVKLLHGKLWSDPLLNDFYLMHKTAKERAEVFVKIVCS